VSGTQQAGEEGSLSKKRKLLNEAGSARDTAQSAGLTADAELKFYVQDMSFSLPQRKKLRLEMTDGSGSSSGAGYLRARNQASNEVEFGIELSKIGEFGSYNPGSEFINRKNRVLTL
jgi:hypothetical protein